MSIILKVKASQADEFVSPSTLNSSISEIQANLNKIGITRSVISNPVKDYLLYSDGSLFLKTIEGDTKEIALT